MSVDVWVFGYGSLIFRPDFPVLERRVARVRGYVRRFWQRSPDHRGTPEAPGRVVTLVPDAEGIVLGVAYRIAAVSTREVLADLDQRERAGYERTEVEIELGEAYAITRAVVYQARRGNPEFSDRESNQQIAEIVRGAIGPSGDNVSYVRRLAQALRDLGADDPHVFEIERMLGEGG